MEKTPTDYKKELEKAAKQMILIHRVDTLVKIILRTIVRTLKLEHAGLILYDETRDAYVANASKGKSGLKIPKGFSRISKDNPIIRYFTNRQPQSIGSDYLLFEQIENSTGAFHEDIKNQFLLYNAKACIPGFFRNKLIFALFLGEKLDRQGFTAEELGFMSVLSSDTVMAVQNAWLFQDLNEQLQKNTRLFLQTALALSSAIEAKDPYTQGHTERVAKYSLVVANELKATRGIPKNEKNLLENLRISSLLHDIGKIGIPEKILNKNGLLNQEELEEMKKHPLIGANILSMIDEFHAPILGVKYHHEHHDGSGYPEGLKGEKIPLIAQIISVADTFDAMITERPYRHGLSKEEAARLIEN
jgi:HD-GYP domain-containing protein (c-di-GMP phosphodiesterase class II)